MGIEQSILSENSKSDRQKIKLNTSVLILICGATAVGKSGLALSLAQRLGCKILSADSRQVYREFNIGTAKPTVDEQKIVKHELIDICSPLETLTVADYQEQAKSLIEENPQSLLVGGTGLYIKSIVRGMKIPRVAPQLELRSHLQSWGQPTLYAMLQQVDPDASDRIHANDQVRTLRALEVFYVTGIPMSEQQGEEPPTYPILQIGLESDQLEQRIQKRTGQMLDMGFEAEVKGLCEKYGEDLPLLSTLGYAEMKQYLRGEISYTEAERFIVLHTRQFAKRQRTWFRADPTIEWFDSSDLETVWHRITEFLADTK
jgi:tRNA dimethylallyltransferase